LENLHALMLDTLVPSCAALIEAAIAVGELAPGIAAYTLMRAVGNLCILGPGYEQADAKHMVARLLAGCRPSLPVPATAVASTSSATTMPPRQPGPLRMASAGRRHGSRPPRRARGRRSAGIARVSSEPVRGGTERVGFCDLSAQRG
jgi:hypothetical protein